MEKILEEVKKKHELVLSRGENVIFTALIGSQNYGLATENSDIDTYSFILPSYDDFLLNKEPKSYEIECEDGSKACVKDIRLLFKLLKKPSPNSIECILSKYIIYNQDYEKVLKFYLDTDICLYAMVHCNKNNFFDSVAGTIRGLHGRNMSIGKKYSHVIRLVSLVDKYINKKEDIHDYLLVDNNRLPIAYTAKNGGMPWLDEEIYKNLAELNANLVLKQKELFVYEEESEMMGRALIDKMQISVMERFLELNEWTRKN